MNKVINVGTTNNAKLLAVKELVSEMPFLKGYGVKSVEADSGVVEQPKSFEEIVKGAKNRAENSFWDCDLSVGIEDGMIEVPEENNRHMNFCCVAVYDGVNFHYGFTPSFEFPPDVIAEVQESGIKVGEALDRVYNMKDISQGQGSIGVLTKGDIPRKDYIKMGLRMAFLPILRKDLYHR